MLLIIEHFSTVIRLSKTTKNYASLLKINHGVKNVFSKIASNCLMQLEIKILKKKKKIKNSKPTNNERKTLINRAFLTN